jgi:hypothetical protein
MASKEQLVVEITYQEAFEKYLEVFERTIVILRELEICERYLAFWPRAGVLIGIIGIVAIWTAVSF